MSDRINLLQRVADMDVSPVFSEYTHVRILTDRKAKDEETGEEYDVVYEAAKPNDTGRLLELTCPWGSQTMAENILNRINPDAGVAFRYQPYSAKGAMLDPAAELGDGVTVKGVSGGVYSQTENFGVRHLSDIEAPTDEEIDHEYPYEPQKDRQTERKFAIERAERIAELAIQQDQIDAKVEAVYDNGATTTSQKFGWQLTADKFIVYGGSGPSNPVLKVTNAGLEVKGKIQADTGYIGGSGGFTIQSGKLYSGEHSTFDSSKAGVFIGTNGISLGNNKFKVDSSGNLTATSGTFTGYINANRIRSEYGSGNNYNSGAGSLDGKHLSGKSITGGQNGKIAESTITSFNCTDFYADSGTVATLQSNMATLQNLLFFGATGTSLRVNYIDIKYLYYANGTNTYLRVNRESDTGYLYT